MRNTKWKYQNNNNSNSSNFENMDKDILNILSNRGIEKKEDVLNFLNPSLKNLKNPCHLSDVEKARDRILKAIEKKESIWIYGDYDVDGITSTALCYLSLKEIGANINYYIPLRDEGYGLNCEALTYISQSGGNLVITVDCGITSHKEITHGNSLGLDIIVTDHHDIIENKMPDAFAVINPKREDNIYSFKYLAGVGTAFNLILAIYDFLNKKAEAFKYLDLVAIGTVADIVKLTEDNRIFVKHGLEILKHSSSKGLTALLKVLFFENYEEKIYNPYDIGFIIAPVFNAAGRLEDAKTSVELLICQDHTKYVPIIPLLIENNKERKEIQENILNKSLEEIEVKELEKKNLILIANEDFHHGVIGIVASKILDKFYKPTIVMEINSETGIAKGSCRSTENFNMIEALTKFSHYLLKFGGHHGAAGFSIKIENLDNFYKDIEAYCEEILGETDRLKPVKIEDSIPLYKVGFNLIENLKTLEPYGFGNPTPLFSVEGVNYSNLRPIGKDKNHLMMNLVQNGVEIKNAVWFNSGDLLEELETFGTIDVAFKLKMESYKERLQYKMFIEDIKSNIDFKPNLKEKIVVEYPLKTVIYTRRILTDENLRFNLESSEGEVFQNNLKIGSLDIQTTYILKNSNLKFIGKIDQILETNENRNVYISIYPDYTFSSYALKDSQLFQDIKTYLLSNKDYSELEKNILSSIFRKKESVDLNIPFSKELENVILTLGIYCKEKKLKLLVVTHEPLNDKIKFFCEINNDYIVGYDYYIILENGIKIFKNNI
ncbi:MAG: single-stranded-DNA-specific exonuclease RecJ [Fusobacteriaceae bacterium]